MTTAISLKTHDVYPEIQVDDENKTWVARLYKGDGNVAEEFTGTAETRQEAVEKAWVKIGNVSNKYLKKGG